MRSFMKSTMARHLPVELAELPLGRVGAINRPGLGPYLNDSRRMHLVLSLADTF